MSRKKPTKPPVRVRQRRRRMLTFMRMCRYGVNNFSRNIWLTVAATAVMSITLLIIFMTLVARDILIKTVADASSKVDMSIYLKTDTPESDIMKIKSSVEKLENVKSVRYISPEEARSEQANQNKKDIETLEAIKEAANKMPATLRVSLNDINDTSSLDNFIKNDQLYKEVRDPTKVAALEGPRRGIIVTIGSWVRFAEIGGGIATLVFVIISSLVVFNTIRMAIFNRQDEIQMMKLIGAERSFIRGPFLVEAIMYGFIASIVATVSGYGLLFAARDPLANWLPIAAALESLLRYVGFVFLAMIITGAFIGIISSYIATRKYLKI